LNTQLKKLSGVALAVTLSLSANTVQAEGFLSGLFSGSDSAGFNTLLENVPADTAYLIGNKNPIPEKEMKEHMQRGVDMLSLLTNPDNMAKDGAEKEEPNVGSFFIALLEEYNEILAKEKSEESGLSLEANSVFYGYETMPVLRVSISNKEKLIELIKRAEKKSSYKVEFTKCGEFDCFENTSPDGTMSIAAVISKDHLAISGFTADKKESVKKHLMGEAKPKTAYSAEKWDNFLKENNYPGLGDGFISVKGIFEFVKPIISAQLHGMDEKTRNSCISVAEDHIQNIPEIIVGTKNFTGSEVDYELLIKTSEVVSTALQTIANDTNISHRTEGAVFDLGLNINFPKFRDALTQYSGFLIKSGETNECPMIDAQEIRKSMGGMAVVMNMGLAQFSSIYASISDVQLDKEMQPEKIDALISLGSNDPAGILALAGSMVPPLAELKIPTDGSSVKLPDGILPSGGVKTPDVFLSQSEKAINILIGNDKPTLSAHKNDTLEISFSSLDYKGYMKILTGIFDTLPSDGDSLDFDIFKKLSENVGTINSTTSADKRGLVVNYNIKY